MHYIPYFDAHCDTLSRCIAQGWDLYENPGHLDLKRLSAYAPVGQVFAIFLDSEKVPAEDRWGCVKEQADLFWRLRREHPEVMGHCALSLEGAELLGCDEGRLEELRAWGEEVGEPHLEPPKRPEWLLRHGRRTHRHRPGIRQALLGTGNWCRRIPPQ